MSSLAYNRAFSQNNNISYQCVVQGFHLLSMVERIDNELISCFSRSNAQTYLFYPRSSDHKNLSGSAYGTSLTNSVDPGQTVPVSRLIRGPHRLPEYAGQETGSTMSFPWRTTGPLATILIFVSMPCSRILSPKHGRAD